MFPKLQVLLTSFAIVTSLVSGKDVTEKDVPKVDYPELKQSEVPVVTQVSQLPADQLYVIGSSVQLVIADSPAGVITIVERKGPISIYGKFVDGLGNPEFRDYPQAWVYIVQGKVKGKVELLEFREFKRSSLKRTSLDVLGGSPNPNPPPDPEVLSQFQKDLRAAYKLESLEDKALLPKLVEFYTEAKAKVDEAATWVGLFKSMQELAASKKTASKLPETAKVIATQLKLGFPAGDLSPTLAISPTEKVKVKEVFTNIADELKKVK